MSLICCMALASLSSTVRRALCKAPQTSEIVTFATTKKTSVVPIFESGILNEYCGGTKKNNPNTAPSSVDSKPGLRPPNQAESVTAMTNGKKNAVSARILASSNRNTTTASVEDTATT